MPAAMLAPRLLNEGESRKAACGRGANWGFAFPPSLAPPRKAGLFCRRAGPRLPIRPMKNPPERGCSGGWQSLEAQSVSLKVVLVPLIGRSVFPAKFLKPSNEPRPSPLHRCSHGDLLHPHPTYTIQQGWRREVTAVTHRRFGHPILSTACSAGSHRHRTSPAAVRARRTAPSQPLIELRCRGLPLFNCSPDV